MALSRSIHGAKSKERTTRGPRPRSRDRLARPEATASMVPRRDANQALARLAPLGAFVALLALYVVTLAPTVVGGDSGELTAAALTGGVPIRRAIPSSPCWPGCSRPYPSALPSRGA